MATWANVICQLLRMVKLKLDRTLRKLTGNRFRFIVKDNDQPLWQAVDMPLTWFSSSMIARLSTY